MQTSHKDKQIMLKALLLLATAACGCCCLHWLVLVLTKKVLCTYAYRAVIVCVTLLALWSSSNCVYAQNHHQRKIALSPDSCGSPHYLLRVHVF
jgi:hypothetical protein